MVLSQNLHDITAQFISGRPSFKSGQHSFKLTWFYTCNSTWLNDPLLAGHVSPGLFIPGQPGCKPGRTSFKPGYTKTWEVQQLKIGRFNNWKLGGSTTENWEVQQLKIVLLYVVTQFLVCRRWVFDGSSYSVPEFLVTDAACSPLAIWRKFLRQERLEVRCVLVGHVQLLPATIPDRRPGPISKPVNRLRNGLTNFETGQRLGIGP